VPYWAKDIKIGYRLINARVETLKEKPAFKQAYRIRRCLVPANGFYEWDKQNKQPYRLFLSNDELFSMAGLWEQWLDAEKRPYYSFVIITTSATGDLRKLHDRMPLILNIEDETKWLETDNPHLLDKLLSRSRIDQLQYYPVSKKVNKTINDGPELIYPIDSSSFQQTLFD
jgi:putative SOS response-associated peptidase YedK